MALERLAAEPVTSVPESPEFETFFIDAYERLVRVLIVVTGSVNEAEDVVQEAMTRAYGRWDRVSAAASPIGYVYRTAVNVHRSRLRRLRTALRHLPDTRAADDMVTADLRISLQRALDKLPSTQRDALVMTDWLGLDSVSAGALLRIAPESVRGRVHRAKTALREHLRDER